MINTITFTKDLMIITKGVYSRKNPKILKKITLEYPDNVYANDEIIDSVKLSHEIVAALKQHKMKEKEVIFAIQHEDINIVDLTVPYIKKHMGQAVNAKLSESYLGVMEKNLISYKIAKTEGNLCYGTAAIAPKALINSYYDLSLKLGMKLKAIDYMGNVLYKSMFHEMKDVKNDSFLIADLTGNEIVIYFYSDGALRLARNESGNTFIADNEVIDQNFVFESKLSITDEDIVEVKNINVSMNKDLMDLEAFYSTLNVFLKRYASEERSENEILGMEETLENIKNIIIDLKKLCFQEIDFVDVNEQLCREHYIQIEGLLQKVDTFFKKAKVLNESFFKEITNLLDNMTGKNQNIIDIFGKYLLHPLDQEKKERRKVIQRVCQLANNILLVADMSGQYADISKIYIQGMYLDSKEKQLVTQNMGKNYNVECVNYENWISNQDEVLIGSLYNEYSYFKDLNLAESLDKNDKINRKNYDNVIWGIGWSSVVAVVVLLILSGVFYFDIYKMNETIKDNKAFIKKNADIYELINQEKDLQQRIDEFGIFEEYFTLANVDLDDVYHNLMKLGSDIHIQGIEIDEDFRIKISAIASQLSHISVYTETLIKNNYVNVEYSNVSAVDDGYKVEIGLDYIPTVAEKE